MTEQDEITEGVFEEMDSVPASNKNIQTAVSQRNLGFQGDVPEELTDGIIEKYKALDEPMVVKRNELILGRYALTKKSHKFFNALITYIDPFSSEIKPIVLKLTDIARMLNISRTAVYKSMKEISKELIVLNVTLNMSKKTWENQQKAEIAQAHNENRPVREVKKPDDKSWEKIPIFSKIVYNNKDQSVFIQMHDEAAPFLANLKGHFTYYHLTEILDVRSSYAVRLYEICRSMLPLTDVEKGQKVASKTFVYQEFRDVLGVIATTYDVFNKFESKILKPAMKALRSTDLVFSYKVLRRTPQGKPHAIIIVTSVNNQINIARQIEKDDGSWQLFIKTFTEGQKKRITNFNDARVKRNVEYFQHKNNEVAIKSPKVWTIKAIKEDYAGIDFAEKFPSLDTITRRFIKEVIVPNWNTPLWEDEDRDAIASGKLNTDTLKAQYSIFKRKNKPIAEKRADITANVLDIENTDW
jgi:plasmid replication initiation protein